MNELYFKLCLEEDSASVDSADAEQSSLDSSSLYTIDDIYNEISYSNKLETFNILCQGILVGVVLMFIFYMRFKK